MLYRILYNWFNLKSAVCNAVRHRYQYSQIPVGCKWWKILSASAGFPWTFDFRPCKNEGRNDEHTEVSVLGICFVLLWFCGHVYGVPAYQSFLPSEAHALSVHPWLQEQMRSVEGSCHLWRRCPIFDRFRKIDIKWQGSSFPSSALLWNLQQ